MAKNAKHTPSNFPVEDKPLHRDGVTAEPDGQHASALLIRTEVDTSRARTRMHGKREAHARPRRKDVPARG